ncbi:MAG TPA: precorrin-2 C(20)-methyltransferase [Chitinophaga sp.]|uniref:precorrin-2 C(20)-methyltransferase n=1 Tax=Chitinophaga sp. TaxID=1869181 RepID=UPI002CF5E124|nr:precorrin-2 C(20)-methyltransferase [Chitinophaga sp.]HVI45279.1 precorrin-2 C(20)-methyltransferase [Chitinophaga sp.]
MSKKGKIYAVSLGPGDPELITLKGWKALQCADKIYYPASRKDGGVRSFAQTIMKQYNLSGKIWQPLILEMSHNRTHNLSAYAEISRRMKADVENGLQVAFVSEGDISFYSTFIYLLKHIREYDLPLEIIAGVPSFLLATAMHQEPLALLRDKIAIIPFLESAGALRHYLTHFETVVLIKVHGAWEFITPALDAGDAAMLYSEKLGTTDQYISADPVAVGARTLPYFSLIILKSNICN